MRSKEIFNNSITKSFLRVAREASKYHKLHVPVPKDLAERYEKELYNYCNYLDAKELYMPAPKHRWDCQDRRTWKYKDVMICTEDGKIAYKGHLLNEKWEGR